MSKVEDRRILPEYDLGDCCFNCIFSNSKININNKHSIFCGKYLGVEVDLFGICDDYKPFIKRRSVVAVVDK